MAQVARVKSNDGGKRIVEVFSETCLGSECILVLSGLTTTPLNL